MSDNGIGPSEYTVKCNIIGGRLSITLYEGETIAKAVNINIDQVDGTYGEFIYVELFGTTRGVLLTDLDETRTTRIVINRSVVILLIV